MLIEGTKNFSDFTDEFSCSERNKTFFNCSELIITLCFSVIIVDFMKIMIEKIN